MSWGPSGGTRAVPPGLHGVEWARGALTGKLAAGLPTSHALIPAGTVKCG